MPTQLQRRLAIVLSVVVFHVGALWALQSGLLKRAVELVIPVQVMAEFIEPPQPQIEPPPPAPPVATPAPPKPRPRPVPQPLPQPVATPTPEPSALAPVVPPSPPAPPAPAEPVVAAAPPAPPAPAAPPRIELPSSSADYLNNPRPPYPPLSKRLGEQGKVVVRVFIEVDGTATRAEVRQSSGFERLDQTAVQTVLRWRYVPGKRAGVPEAMWFNVPINFVLE
ncbi:energy transducer TonB [Hydrogenophaga sp.]|uniref:energy transducer TonB n=1 Tax=Hydrogenophaga sp. TaxID=1904254 RepID=UPI003AF9C2CE